MELTLLRLTGRPMCTFIYTGHDCSKTIKKHAYNLH